MLKQELPPNVDNGFTSCYEAAVSHIVYNNFLNYSYMFTMFWGFEYRFPDGKDTLKGRFIGGGLYKSTNYLYDLYGLTFIDTKINDMQEFISALELEQSQGNSIILAVDTFDCPWNIGYQKFNMEHFIVVTHFDLENSTLHCQDSFCNMENIKLHINSLKHMKEIRYIRYRMAKNAPLQNIFPFELLYRAAVHYYRIEKSHDNIIAFSRELAQNDIYATLTSNDLTIVGLDPFFIKFKGIVSGRKNLLLFIKENGGNWPISTYLTEMRHISTAYNDVYLLLLKCMSRKGNVKYMQNAAEQLQEIAAREQKIAKKIIEDRGANENCSSAT